MRHPAKSGNSAKISGGAGAEYRYSLVKIGMHSSLMLIAGEVIDVIARQLIMHGVYS